MLEGLPDDTGVAISCKGNTEDVEQVCVVNRNYAKTDISSDEIEKRQVLIIEIIGYSKTNG